MILICDENISPRATNALRHLGYDARSFRDLGWMGLPDLNWLPMAAQISDSLVLSRDKMMLDEPAEIRAIIDNNIGIVILTSGQQPWETLFRLIADSWELLESLHNNTPRPFARLLTTEGNLRQQWHGIGF